MLLAYDLSGNLLGQIVQEMGESVRVFSKLGFRTFQVSAIRIVSVP